jgi:hypothetical protein
VFPQTFFAGWLGFADSPIHDRTNSKASPKKSWLLAVHNFSMHKPAAVI